MCRVAPRQNLPTIVHLPDSCSPLRHGPSNATLATHYVTITRRSSAASAVINHQQAQLGRKLVGTFISGSDKTSRAHPAGLLLVCSQPIASADSNSALNQQLPSEDRRAVDVLKYPLEILTFPMPKWVPKQCRAGGTGERQKPTDR